MGKKKISAKIIADSCDNRGNRITSYLLTYPRFIHGEIMTHRMFSRNAASSRAIPFEKMVQQVKEDSFIPIAFQKDHKGMQGTEYLVGREADEARASWVESSRDAITQAETLTEYGVTKQLCNRLLEPFQWMTTLVTATELDGFFNLRCPSYEMEWMDTSNGLPGIPKISKYKSKKDCSKEHYNDDMDHWTIEEWQSINTSQAEIHIQALAEAMWDAKNGSTPRELASGEWHIPFGDKITPGIVKFAKYLDEHGTTKIEYPSGKILKTGKSLEGCSKDFNIKIATARCARLSYMTFDGEIDYEKDIKLHNQLLKSKHASPFEHCCRVLSNEEYYSNIKGVVEYGADGETVLGIETDAYGWCNNFKGFIPYRHLVNL